MTTMSNEQLAAGLRAATTRREALYCQIVRLLAEHPSEVFTVDQVAAGIDLRVRIAFVDEALLELVTAGTIDAYVTGGRWAYRRPASRGRNHRRARHAA